MHNLTSQKITVQKIFEAGAVCQAMLLCLDFDGTLVPFASEPGMVRADDDLIDLLENLNNRDGIRVAVISGRSLADLSRRLPVNDSIILVGSHGAEIQWSGRHFHKIRLSPKSVKRLQKIEKVLSDRRYHWSGCFLERKPFGTTFHYRRAPEDHKKNIVADITEKVTALLVDDSIELIHGKEVVEIRAAGFNKGKAIEKLLETDKYRGFFPVHIGDDCTDEDAFRELFTKGIGIIVGLPPIGTHARYFIPDIRSVRELLKQLHATWPNYLF